MKLSHACAIIAPPMPAFCNLPQSLDDIVRRLVGRALDMLETKNNITKRWCGEAEHKKLKKSFKFLVDNVAV